MPGGHECITKPHGPPCLKSGPGGHISRREDPASSQGPSLFSQNLAAAREVRGLEQAAAELQARMQKKATLVARDAFNLSLSSVQTLQQQHRCLEVRVHPQGLPT